MRLSIVVAVILLSESAWNQVEVPHAFEAGTVAKAAEVNENFAALRGGSEIQSRFLRPRRQVVSCGGEIGELEGGRGRASAGDAQMSANVA